MLAKSLLVLGLVLVLVSACGYALAWSIGTHVYIAERCLPQLTDPQQRHQAFYGAMLPDLVAAYVVSEPEVAPVVRSLTHLAGCDRASGCANGSLALAFASGWLTHNEHNGADLYAHGICPTEPCEPPGYVDRKTSCLSQLPPSAQHFFVETALDMLVRRHLDPMLGRKVADAARYRDQQIVEVLVKAYCPPLEPDTLREAENHFRYGAVAYGNALSLPQPLDLYTASAIIAAQTALYSGYPMSAAQASQCLTTAMETCSKDYQKMLDETIKRVRKDVVAPAVPGPSPATPSRPLRKG